MNMYVAISTFAGVGGSSQGYKQAGIDVQLAVEFDKRRARQYAQNHPQTHVVDRDITQVSVDELKAIVPYADIIDGSPPCQGFSTAGKRNLDDPRNRLFMEFVRIIREYQPKAIIMENVKGLNTGASKKVFAEINEELRGAGYKIACRQLNAWWYGTPQNRTRLIWVGFREDLGIEPSHPEPTHSKPVTVSEALPHDDIAWISRDSHTGRYLTGLYLCTVDPATSPLCTVVKANPPFYVDSKGKLHKFDERQLRALAGFPPHYIIDVIGIGSAVPPPMSQAIGRHVMEQLDAAG